MAWLDRTLELKESRAAQNKDDEGLLHLIGMFAWLNACGIRGQTTPDAAHDPVNKDLELQERYRTARAEA